jgi:Ni/Co efflux regulator RcnB
MKLKTTLLAATLIAFAASTAYAAEEAMTKKDETPKTEKTVAKKPVKKHDHAAEKTGSPSSEAKGMKSHKETMDKDMPMHDHTQDRH